ncbi:MAG: glycosyltransferase [Pseudomonadota bacterium]
MTNAPTVSVLIPCHNASAFIEQAVASALEQTHRPLEVIVIDDGSTDDSASKLEAFADRIRFIRQPNAGSNITRNRLLQLASGEWIQYLDADDYLEPHKLAEQLAHRAAPSADVLLSYVRLRLDGAGATRWLDERRGEPGDAWALMLGWHMPQLGGALWRRRSLLDAGAWREEQPCCQDSELYLRCLEAGQTFVHTRTDGAVYREWSEQTLSRANRELNWQMRLALTDAAEQFLQERQLMGRARQHAADQSRFELARIIWLTRPDWAGQVVAAVRAANPRFSPAPGRTPWLYRMLFKVFGFGLAERVARLRRRLRHSRALVSD